MFNKILMNSNTGRIKFIWKFVLIILTCLVVGKIAGASIGVLLESYFVATRGIIVDINEIIDNETINVLLIFIEQFLILLILHFFIRKIDKYKFEDLGVILNRRNIFGFLRGFFIGALAISILVLILIKFGFIQNTYFIAQDEDFGIKSFLGIMLFELALFFCVSLQEETFFRAYIPMDINTLSPKKIYIISSLLFAFMHIRNSGVVEMWNNIIQDFANFSSLSELQLSKFYINVELLIVFLFNLFLVAMIFVKYYYKTRDFGTIVGIHAGLNFFQSSIFGFSVSGINIGKSLYSFDLVNNINKQLLTGGKTLGLEAGWLMTAMILEIGLMLYILNKINYKHKRKEMLENDEELI